MTLSETRATSRLSSRSSSILLSDPPLSRPHFTFSPQDDYISEAAELPRLEVNRFCADCDAENPDWASLNLGILLCITCAGVHRTLGVQISKVRSLHLDTDCWDRGQLDFMRSVGNVRARQIYEATCPCWFLRPSRDNLSAIVREHWIRAKYERHDFVANPNKPSLAVSAMPEPPREGYLWKANKKGTWQKRYFVLYGRFLAYFKSPSDSYPKGIIDVCELTFTLPNGADSNRRYVFEAHTGKRSFPFALDTAAEVIDWVHALKRSAAYYITLLNAEAAGAVPAGTAMALPAPGTNDEEIKLTYQQMGTPIKTGLLSKQGGKWKSWNQRLFVLTDTMLYYFKKEKPAPTDFPEGGVPLTQSAVTEASERAEKANCVCITTPTRAFFICAVNESEKESWHTALSEVCERLNRVQQVAFSEMPQPEPIRNNGNDLDDDSD